MKKVMFSVFFYHLLHPHRIPKVACLVAHMHKGPYEPNMLNAKSTTFPSQK
jgi:hypothetical protein